MPTHFARPLVAGAIAAVCLAAAPRDARADPPPAPRVQASIETGDESLEVFDQTDQVTTVAARALLLRTHVYKPICASTPCRADLAPGAHVLALSTRGGPLMSADTPLLLAAGPVSLKGKLVDRSTVRSLGYLTLLATSMAGTAMFVLAQGASSVDSCDPGQPANYYSGSPARPPSCGSHRANNEVLEAAGLGVLLGGLFAATAMAMTLDSVSFEVVPIHVGAGPGRREADVGSMVPNGLALSVRF